jgi:hypothetical protein
MTADIVGATPMDRPEWITVAVNGEVYCTLTNNSERTTADAANPLAPNPDSHIIRWRDADRHVGLAFTWDIYVNVQHPGNGDPALTNFPAPPDGISVPRDATVVISRKGGGVIGS